MTRTQYIIEIQSFFDIVINSAFNCLTFRMVLVFNGVMQDDCPMDTSTLFMQHPVYRDYANQLLSIPTKTVSTFLITHNNLLT